MHHLIISFIPTEKFDKKIVDATVKTFGMDCIVMISDPALNNINLLLKNQEKMAQIVSKNNISAVFTSFASKGNCAYFINILDMAEMAEIVQKISEKAPNIFQQLPWFLMYPDPGRGVPELGIKLQFNSNINLLQPLGDTFVVHELYALGDQAILNKIGIFQGGRLEIENLDKLSRRRDLQGITIR